MAPRVGQWSGWVYKQGSRMKTWKKRYMVLQGRHVTYYDKPVYEPNPSEKGALVLVDVTQNFAIANGLFLHDDKGKQMKIYTDTSAEFQDCLVSMQRACRGNAPPAAPSPVNYRPSGNPDPVALSRPSRTRSEQVFSQQHDPRMAAPERGVSERISRMDLRSPDRGAGDNQADFRGSSVPKLTKTPSDRPIRSKEVIRGWLHKEGQHIRNWKRRYFVLTGDHLAYFGKQGEAPKGEGRVLEVAENPNKAFGLVVRLDSDRILRVAAESEDDMERWHSAFRSALKNQEFLERRITKSVRYSGYLQKKGSNIKTWHRRWFMLQGLNQLGYCDKEGETPKGYGKVLDVCVNHKRPYCLYIHLDSGRRLSVAAESQEEIDGWFQVLSKVAAAVAQTQQAKAEVKPDSIHTSHKGWLQKEGNSFKSWKRRYFTLHGRMLVYHKEIEGNAVGQGIVQGVTEGTSRPFALDIHFETGRVLRVAANSERDRSNWVTALNRVISNKSEEAYVAPAHLRKPTTTLVQTNQITPALALATREGPMEGWLEWEGGRTYFTLNGRELKYFANPNGLVLGKGTLKDMRVENFRDFIMHIVFTNSNPIRVKAETNDELNAWRGAITGALKGQLAQEFLQQQQSAKVIQEGWMLKEGKKVKSWKRRFFVLQGTNLLYYKNESKESVLGQGSFVHVKPNPEKQWSLVIILESGRLLVVALNSDQEEAMWLRAFQSALQSATVAPPTFATVPAGGPTPVTAPPVAAPVASPAAPAGGEIDDEYDDDSEDDIYTTNFSDNGGPSSRSLGYEDFDDDDDDDIEDLEDDSDGGSISSGDGDVHNKGRKNGGYDSDGLSSLSSLSDFED
ncbi:unnamed protein product [Aphanomyces euteiches]